MKYTFTAASSIGELWATAGSAYTKTGGYKTDLIKLKSSTTTVVVE